MIIGLFTYELLLVKFLLFSAANSYCITMLYVCNKQSCYGPGPPNVMKEDLRLNVEDAAS